MMAADRPIGERVATLESENKTCGTDRRDLWEAINQLRPLPVQLKAFADKLDEIRDLCEPNEKRIDNLEKRVDIATGERNIVFGVIGFGGSIIGGIATWLVTHFIGPLIKS